MSADPEYYTRFLSHLGSDESLTVLVVRGRSRVETAEILDVDLAQEGDLDDWPDEGSVWSLVEIPDGVLAIEQTGYGDPTVQALRDLSRAGGAAAVVRHNIQAHLRFGAARDGELVFDDDEYLYVEDPSSVPAELRPLFDLVWVDLDLDDDLDDDGPGFRGPGLVYHRVGAE